MLEALRVDILKPDELAPSERAAWEAFRAADASLASPYFDLRYTLAAGAVAPHARVAVIHRCNRVIGFLPFQRRGGLIQPLGAPMTDYHGVIAAPGERIDTAALVSALGGRAFRFSGLKGEIPQSAGAGLVAHEVMAADLSAGFDDWLERRQALHPRFFKGKRRAARAIERDLGPLRLDWSREAGPLLDHVLRLKRAQYLRTRRHDVFACGWTERLLRRLDEDRADDFGLTFAALYAGDVLVGAEVGLMSGGVHHLWLPVYEPAYGRYGPGMLMTVESLRAAAGAGLTRVDFGRADAEYKAYFADPAGAVLEGTVHGPGPSPIAAADRLLAAAARPFGRLAALRERVRRRVDVIAACETTAWGWCAAAVLALGVIAGANTPVNNVQQARRSHDRPGHQMIVRAEARARQEADQPYS